MRRLRRFRELQELDLPLIVLVGGATGTGKSTVATEAAYRLGITRVTSTDFVRQTMRAFFSKEFMPSIHYSSFEAAAGLREPEQAEDPVIAGFLEQTRNVLVGVRASIERALEEGWSMVLEGVHLVPGMLPRVEGALVVQCVLAIEDEEEHSTHFMVRDAGLDGLRPHSKYLDRLDDIRRVQDHIVAARQAPQRPGDREQRHQAGDRFRPRARAGERRTGTTGLMAETVDEAVNRRGAASGDEPLSLRAVRPCHRRWCARRPHGGSGGRIRRPPSEMRPRRCMPFSAISRSDGRVVIGSAMEDSPLRAGQDIGAGGETVDLALDPLEGRGVVARGGNGAMSMIAVGERGSLLELPDMYMRKMAVGPRARGSIDLLKSMGENVQAIADAFGRRPNDITTIVLDRPRHHDLIEEIRASGARIKLIQDGTVTASISAAIRGTNDHLAVGIGGTRQAVMTAAALRCLGGELQAQLWPTSRREIDEARELGIEDATRVFTTEELAPGEVIVAATGVSNGDLLRGVRYLTDSRAHALARHVHAL